MNREFTWEESYRKCLKEKLTVKDICILRHVSVNEGLRIRKRAIEYIASKAIGEFEPPKSKVDTDAVLAVTGHDEDYYYSKMQKERKIKNGK